MQVFVDRFREEVREYFERLESGLLVLENDPENQQVIDEIFRLMHSMKGSGGMFGFDLLSDVTHDLESLYDIFKSKKQRIDSETISFTLHSIDGLHHLMVQEPKDEDILLAEKMKKETKEQILRLSGVVHERSNEPEKQDKSLSAAEENQNTYFISFIPDEDIFDNGTNPLYLIDELYAFGECIVNISYENLPDLAEIDPQKCYVSWNIFIVTTENIETLHDVFIFVTEHAKIQIDRISSGNVIHSEKVLADFLNAQQNKEVWTPLEAKITKQDVQEPQIRIEEPEKTELPENVTKMQSTVDSIRVDSVKIDHYMNLVSELITAQSRLMEVSSRLNNPELEVLSESFEKLSRQLRDNAFEMSLIPLQSIAVRFNRLIHDLSKSLDKTVVLETSGLETELDKNIIEKLIEPLLHIIRNSIDHGIERRKIREDNKKPSHGSISIAASTIGSYVQIVIEDDGAGLDIKLIKKKAIEKGLISEKAKLSDKELFELIFEPGFSTSTVVTDVSGRGVGMDVVRRRIHEMRGSVELESEKNRFTRFTIKLPLSLSIIDGLLTTVGDGYYVIPTSVVQKIHCIKNKMLKKNFRQVVEFDNDQIPYLNMHEEFYKQIDLPEEQYVVVVSHDSQTFGLVVDSVVREYQAVIKPLGRLLKEQDVFSGASILGTGQLALVIDTNKMIQKYSQ